MRLFCKIDWVILFVFACEYYRLCAGLHCYVGVVHKAKRNESSNQLASINCSFNIQDKLSGVTSGPLVNTTASGIAVNKSGVASSNCVIFYDPVVDKAQFACDEDNVCRNKQGSLQNSMCYRQKMGSLYCCEGNLCNTASRLYHMNPPQANTVCYSGINNGTQNITEVECRTSWCYYESTFTGGHLVKRTFGCQSQCNSSHSSKTSCSETRSANDTRRRICFCSDKRCNSDVGVVVPVDKTVSSKPLSTTTRPPLLSMSNPLYGSKDEQSSRRMWFKTTVVSSAVVVTLLLIILIAVVIYRFRRHHVRTLSFTYTQLTADLAESPDGADDDKLLVG